MRPKYIIEGLLEAGIDPGILAALPENSGQDYEALGFPSQGVATRLFREGILRPRGKSMMSNSAGKKVLRTIWGRGVHFEVFLDYWLQNKQLYFSRLISFSENRQKIAV
ncbi:Uncharacterised protein [uncultured archaeon]|nr:Uncharacterised protein [uncultured archaeon]